MNSNGSKDFKPVIIKYLLIATWLTVLINVILLFLPVSFHSIIYGSIQALLPLLCILFSVELFYKKKDKNVKFLLKALVAGFCTWALSNLSWELIPFIYKEDWVYQVTGFGWLFSYMLIALVLYLQYNSKQWQTNVKWDRPISIIGTCAIIIVTALLILKLRPESSRFVGTLIVYSYFLVDVLIITFSSKTVLSNAPVDVKHITLITLIFFFINMNGEILYLMKYLKFFNPAGMIDIVYSIGLLFVTTSMLLLVLGESRVKALREINKKLKDTRSFMDDVIMQSPDGICVCNNKGNAIVINDSFIKIFDIRRSDVLSKFNMFDHLLKRNGIAGSYADAIMRGESVTIPRVCIRKDDKEDPARILHIKVFSTYDSEGILSGYVFLVEDTTEKVKLEDELKKAYSELKWQYARKEDFINVAAHELRTPLTPIIGYTEIMKSATNDEKMLKYLDIVERNAYRQKNIVDKMLVLSRLEAGTVTVTNKEFNASAMASQLIDNYSNSNRNIIANVSPALNINSDKEMITNTLDNLLSNAIKYSQDGSDITLSIEERDRDILFTVKDNGIGISEKDYRNLFEPFYIIDGEKDTRETGRLGLGLSLVKSYVTLLKGHIWLESIPGKGSTFYFTVPKTSSIKPAEECGSLSNA